MSVIFSIYTSETKTTENNQDDKINVGNIAYKIFQFEALFPQWKAKIEFWLFIPPLTHLYQSIDMS